MSFLVRKDKKISPKITTGTMGKALNNAVLLAHSQSGSETGESRIGTNTNQIVIKGPSDPNAQAGSYEDKVIHFTKDGKEYQFKLETFDKLLDQLLPRSALAIDKLTGETLEAYQSIKNAIEQIKAHAPASYPRIVELVKSKYANAQAHEIGFGVAPQNSVANAAPNSLYSYFMGCSKTGELGVCSLACVGSIAHDQKNECADTVFVFEATGQLRAINKLKEGRHVYVYVDPETFSAFTDKHIKSLKQYKVEEVTILTKCNAESDTFQQQRYSIDQLDQHQCPCKSVHPPKPKPDHKPDHGHHHDQKHNKDDGPPVWVSILTIVLVVIIIIMLAAFIYQTVKLREETCAFIALEQEKMGIFREAAQTGTLQIVVNN